MIKIISIFLAALLLILIIVYCEYDHGLAPLPGTLEATIYFRNEPPENTQGIYLVVAPKFPPHAINELFHSPNSLPIDQDTVITTMELPFGHYKAVSLWFYSTKTESNLADILAIPLDPDNNYMPLTFDITPEEPVFKTKMYANWQRVNRDAAIEGTIYFNGPFPDNTLITAIIAYLYEPEESIEFLLWMKSIDFGIDDRLIVLVDDVLNTGRSARAALDALIDLGRPQAIRLAVLIDRGSRELPIRADYVGKTLEVPSDKTIQVYLREADEREEVVVE